MVKVLQIRVFSKALSLAFAVLFLSTNFLFTTSAKNASQDKHSGKAYSAVIYQGSTTTGLLDQSFAKTPLINHKNQKFESATPGSKVLILKDWLISPYERNLFYVHTTINAP